MSFFRNLFESETKRKERVAGTKDERIRKYIASDKSSVSVTNIAEEYEVSVTRFVYELAAAGVYVEKVSSEKRVEALRNLLVTVVGSDSFDALFDLDGAIGICLPHKSTQLIVCNHAGTRVSGNPDPVTHTVLASADLLAVEITEDDEVVSKITNSTKLGSAIVGGVLFGGAGAVVGGLLGSEEKQRKRIVSKVELKVLVNNTSFPAVTIRLLDSKTESSGQVYKEVQRHSRLWLDRIQVLLKGEARNLDIGTAKTAATKSSQAKRAQTKAISVAEELRKLADLQRDGVISSEEFLELKSRLLAKPNE